MGANGSLIRVLSLNGVSHTDLDFYLACSALGENAEVKPCTFPSTTSIAHAIGGCGMATNDWCIS